VGKIIGNFNKPKRPIYIIKKRHIGNAKIHFIPIRFLGTYCR
jgi:hypothetical protein